MRPARANVIDAPPAGSDFRLALAASAIAHAALLATTVPFWTAVRTPAGPGVVEIPVEFVIEPKPAPVLPIPMTAAPPGAVPEIAPARRSDEALSPVVPPAPVAEAVAAADVLQPSAPEALSPASAPSAIAAPVIEALPAPETLAALAAPPAARAVEATEVVLPQTDNLVEESALSPPPRQDTALLQPASPDGGPGAAPIGPADAQAGGIAALPSEPEQRAAPPAADLMSAAPAPIEVAGSPVTPPALESVQARSREGDAVATPPQSIPVAVAAAPEAARPVREAEPSIAPVARADELAPFATAAPTEPDPAGLVAPAPAAPELAPVARPVEIAALVPLPEPAPSVEAKGVSPPAVTLPPGTTGDVSVPRPAASPQPAASPADAVLPSPPGIGGAAEDSPRLAALSVPKAPALPTEIVDPQPAVARVLGELACARVSARFDPARGAVTLSGHVASSESRATLHQRIASLPSVKAVEDQGLHLVGEPYCRVLSFLDQPDLVRSEDQTHDLAAAIGTSGQSGVAHYVGGTPLELRLKAPKFASHIYVDYFSSSGEVYHLLAGNDPRGNRFAPDEAFTVGGARGRGLQATIAPPYGLDLVVAIASSEPLFAKPRPVAERAPSYLDALAGILTENAKRGRSLRVEYAYFIINTTER